MSARQTSSEAAARAVVRWIAFLLAAAFIVNVIALNRAPPSHSAAARVDRGFNAIGAAD